LGSKREARLAYYEGVRQAMVDHATVTENGLRKLKGVPPLRIERLVADVHRRHLKLLRRIDQLIAAEHRDA
jgi:hypothetical protein